jgi:hypothetical protein
MNTFAALFGIFRQRGLVVTLREGRALGTFTITAIGLALLGGLLYGFAMGIGLGLETAITDAIKAALIVALGLLCALPIFWLAYRLLGREERPAQVAAIPLTFVVTSAIVLAVAAPIVFLLSILAGVSQEAVYIHIVIVDVALLIGVYLAGMLVYHGFAADRSRLIVPNVVSFLMLGVILVVLILFFGPFLAMRPTFSVGTDLLKDRLGIGVSEKVTRSLAAAAAADHLSYRFQTTNQNGDLERDYTVTRIGQEYLIEIHLHAVPGEIARSGKRIWRLEDAIFTDLTSARVVRAERAAVDVILNRALPSAAFYLPGDFAGASWRAIESGGTYTAIGTTPTGAQATLTLDAVTLRLSSIVIGSADRTLHAETRVLDVRPATFDRAKLAASLNQAIVIGSVVRADATLQDYVQEQEFFVVRFPRTWRAGSWDAAQHRITFANDCGAAPGCPTLTASIFELAEGKGAKEYAQDLGVSLARQPEYRKVSARTVTIGDSAVGVVDYLVDRTVKGKIETAQHVEYIFVGEQCRYHLDFAAPTGQFEVNRGLFEAMAHAFTYLRQTPQV